MRHTIGLLFSFSLATLIAAEKFDVKIIGRQDQASTYGFVVPGSSQTSVTGSVNCVTYPNAVGCNGSANSTTTSRPAVVGSYQLQGATLALQLPDGRVAVVNCNSKTNWTEFSTRARRSCRIPAVDEITAEFSGDKVTLKWSVSIDGKKLQQETYKIISVIKP